MELLIGILALIVGILMLTIQIKRYIDGYKFKEDNESNQAANIQFVIFGVFVIIVALIYIF